MEASVHGGQLGALLESEHFALGHFLEVAHHWDCNGELCPSGQLRVGGICFRKEALMLEYCNFVFHIVTWDGARRLEQCLKWCDVMEACLPTLCTLPLVQWGLKEELSIGWLGAVRMRANGQRHSVTHRFVHDLLVNGKGTSIYQGPAERHQAQFVFVEIHCCPHLQFERNFCLIAEQDDVEVLDMFFCAELCPVDCSVNQCPTHMNCDRTETIWRQRQTTTFGHDRRVGNLWC